MAKISITKIFTFDSAHSLPGHKGKCANLHGHTYRLEVTVSRQNGGLVTGGSSEGMVMDFGDLKSIVNTEIIEQADHKMLNDAYDFRTTSENLASHYYHVLEGKLSPLGVEVCRIRLWESSTSYVEVGR